VKNKLSIKRTCQENTSFATSHPYWTCQKQKGVTRNDCSWNTLQYHKQRATSRNEGKDDHWNLLVQSYTFEICFNAMLVVDCWGRTSIISTCNCIELILCAVTDFPAILTKSFKLMQRGTASWCGSHILKCLTQCKSLWEVGKDCKQGN
jgi:hypothetical protein